MFSVDEFKVGDRVPIPPAPQAESDVQARWQGDLRAPVVSVICHTYNHAGFIEHALRGFLIQRTTFPYEVIVHDDASDDGTAKIVSSWAEAYPAIVKPIFQTVNQFSRGRKPRTYTYPRALGRYIALCEGDDYWMDPNKLQIQIDFLEANLDFALCSHGALTVDEDRILLEKVSQRDLRPRVISRRDMQRRICGIKTLSMCFRNVKCDFPEEASKILGGDRFFVSWLSQFGDCMHMGNITGGVYRKHAGGVYSSLSRDEKNLADISNLYWLFKYSERSKKQEMSKVFAKQLVERLSDLLVLAGRRTLLKVLFPRAFRVYSRLSNVTKGGLPWQRLARRSEPNGYVSTSKMRDE